MTEFELEYNAVKHASFIMLQGLMAEIALLKGTTSKDWLDQFRDRMLADFDKARMTADEVSAMRVRAVAKSVIENVAEMAKHRVSQVRG